MTESFRHGRTGDLFRADRDAQISDRYKAGGTLEEVGQQFQLSKERVRQILKRLGVLKRERQVNTGRTSFLGVNITDTVKRALQEEAARRGVSVSALSSSTLREMLVELGYTVEAEQLKDRV